MRIPFITISSFIFLLFHGSCLAETPPVSAKQTIPCNTPEYRQFDFWLGKWEVQTPAGKLAGHNHIESILGGCALRENWSGSKGSNGTSINIYDKTNQQWHQTWVDDQGLQLKLSGRYRDGKMILEGNVISTNSKPNAIIKHRIIWEQLSDGQVRQKWTSSKDNGKTWKLSFEGLYTAQKSE